MVNIQTVLRIGTLNLCLGLKFKKDLVRNILLENEIDILLMQETEVEKDFDCELLNIPGYSLECETNDVKRRVGTYVKNTIKYTRRFELEGENNHLLIIDVENGIKTKKRLINIYRSFNPVGLSERDLFTRQLDLIKLAFNNDSALIGDLNLDYKKRYDVNYQRRSLFDLFEDKLGGLNLIQLVKFDTWSRLVGLVLRSSLLDHIYVNNVNLIKNVVHDKPCFGDHELVMAHCYIIRQQPKITQRRDWCHYSKEKLNEELFKVVGWQRCLNVSTASFLFQK